MSSRERNIPDILRTYAVKELEVGSMSIGPLVRQHDSSATCHVMLWFGRKGEDGEGRREGRSEGGKRGVKGGEIKRET